ncbi:LTA synthase family protein [Clostridium sp. D2Q-14]|uniref:LTA synthase family protein n=1 Tax=Anaeromonas gelatinilytica TaxID=2683194 RepID=UPI00193BF244|nr:LTA synthase family protein [Anaeromonas gelatinilytica]MBS4534015.1 LTA synthase family protein [Anaeromonas gelatinilytica]
MFKFHIYKNKKIQSINRIIEIMFIISLLKVLLLYFFTQEKNIISTFLYTIPAIIIAYSIVLMMKSKKVKRVVFIVHFLIAIILFVDLIYYQYYGFLPSITTLLFVGNVPTIWKSIFFILRPAYFIMIIDLIPLGIYLKKKSIKYIKIKNKYKQIFKIIIPILILIVIIPIPFIKGNTTYAYNNYGIFTYHIYDIYTQLINKEEEVIAEKDIDDEVKKITKNTNRDEKNYKKYNGIAKGKNIIMVQFESLQNFLINDEYNGQVLTPNLNKLIKKDSIYFNNFYQQVGPGNTSDAEFVVNNSLYPTNNLSIFNHYNENNYYSLPMILKENGYSTYSFHGNDEKFWSRKDMYPKIGIDNFISLENFNYEQEDIINIGLNDMDFYEQTIRHLKNVDTPFYSMVISVTSHHPYEIPEGLVDIELMEEHKGTLFGNYIQSIHYADKAFGQFIEGLKKEGLYEDSLIVVYGDHSGLYPARSDNEKIVEDYLNVEYKFDEFMNIPLIFHLPNSEISEINETVGGEIDIFPTILNLLGIKNNKGKRFGNDLFNTKRGFVANQYYVHEGSFIDDEKVFEMSEDGIFENSMAWDRETKKSIDIEKCRKDYERAISEIEESRIILQNDLIDDIIREQNKNQDN